MLLFDIHQFNYKVGSIDDIKWLINKKETIKNELMGDVSWEVRMILYKQVHLINKRINELKQIAIS
ncbi:hypothetical protein [Ammoniphilus sp. YIM 78166]|uniref:hypothetical protein n=1 Tax=Ammoniphilus sp. YIM 78166 TaxID=1644106 RepID=UPI00106F279B|nr:hypothetical protein [Ammoniphilus sp. YIM 78166]